MKSYSPTGADPNRSYQDGRRAFRRGWLQPAISAASRYGLALFSVSVAFVLAQTFLSYGLPQPFTAFALAAIASTFWYGGTKPGILAALFSWLVSDYFFEPEVSAESRILYGLVFLVFALVMILVMRGRNELEARVAERTADLKKANEDLTLEIARQKGTEDELRAIIDNAPVFLWSDLPDGYCDFLNQRWLTYFNLSLQEAQGAGWATVLHPDDAAHHLESWQKSVATGIPFETEARYRRPDGEYRWFLNRGVPLRDKTGRIVKWYGTNIDIENLKRIERRLRQSEAYLAEAQRLSRTGSWAINPATRKILYWSEECYRIWGFDPVQGLPYRETVWQRIHPDDRDRVHDEAQEALRQKRDHTTEFRILLPDGTVKYLEAVGHHLFSARGELVEVVGTHIDVTERKSADEALREREAKIRRLVDANIIGIFIWDLDGRIIEANDAFLRMVGYDREDLVSGRMRWTELTPAEWRDPDLRRWLPELKMTGSLQPFEKEYFRKDGSRVPVLIGVAAFEEDGNQGVAFVLDLTERKRVEERLRVQHMVAQVLAEAATIEEATPRILRAMGECLGWDVGALWRVDREAEALRCVELWHKASIEVPEFEGVSREFTFVPGLGLPGRVWSSREPIYIPDVVPDENFPRAHIAEREGLHAAFGFPILLGEEVLGVIEFFSREIRQPDQVLLNMLATIGSQIGQFIERRSAEEALRESEAKIRRLVDANIIGIFIWDFDGRILEANEAFLHMVGYDHEDLVAGRIRWTDLTPPEWRDRDTRLIQEHKVSGALQPFEKEYFRKDGSRVPVLIGVATFEGSENQGVAFVLDLTERKRAEQALRRSEAWLAQAQKISRTGNWVLDVPAKRFLYWSDECYRIWEFDPRQGLPSRESMWGRIHPHDRDRVWGQIQEAEREKRGFFTEFRILLPDGTVKYLEANTQHEFSPLGAVLKAVSTQVDVTERKRADQALRESEGKFRDYTETASDWFWEIGPDYKFTLLTENAFGSDAADRIGTACWDHALDLETEPEKWRLVRATLDSRQPFRDLVYCSAGRNGSSMYVKSSGKPVFDANGEFRGYRGTGTDVTAIVHAREEHERLRQLESDLAHMNRLSVMGELTASLAHEIAQPIATARNNARAAMGFLDRSPPDLSEVREALECLVADADRAGDIIERIRDQIKKAPPRKGRFDLNKAIDEVIVLARSAIIKNGVSVQTRLTEGLAPVQGDRVQLQQVALNLILNAIEAMSSVEAGARGLLISTEQNQTGDVLVAVRDSGPGIDPEHVERVFEAFYTTKSGGTGMGLSICRSIIDAHGGRLWADVNEPRGAAFQFILPRAEKELMNPLPPTQQTGERHEDTASGASRQLAYEGKQAPHRSGREPGQRHWGRQ